MITVLILTCKYRISWGVSPKIQQVSAVGVPTTDTYDDIPERDSV